MSSEGNKSTPTHNIGAEDLGMQKKLPEDTKKSENVTPGKAKGQKGEVANQGEQKSSGGKKSKKKKATNWIDFDTSPWGLNPEVPNPPPAVVRNRTYAEVVGYGVDHQPSVSTVIQQQPSPLSPRICKSDMQIFPKLTAPELSPNHKLQSQTGTGITVQNMAAANKGDVRTNAGAGGSKFEPCKMLGNSKAKTTKALPPTPPMKKCNEPNSIAMAPAQAKPPAVPNSALIHTQIKTNQASEVPEGTPASVSKPEGSTAPKSRAQAVAGDVLLIKCQQKKNNGGMSLFSHAPVPQICIPVKNAHPTAVEDNEAPTSTAALIKKGLMVFGPRDQPPAVKASRGRQIPEQRPATTLPSCSGASKGKWIPQMKGKTRNLPFGMIVPEWNFLDLDRDLVDFPKFDHQFDDENYIAAEQKALMAMELAHRKKKEKEKESFRKERKSARIKNNLICMEPGGEIPLR